MINNLTKIYCLLTLINWSDTSASNEEVWINIDVDGYSLSGKYSPAKQADTAKLGAILIVAGSGATDHNGNNVQMGLENNSYQMLATALSETGYAVLRVDKRGVGKSFQPQFNMAEATFDLYVQDVVAWIEYLKKEHENITVIGHSLGGLMAMQAAQSSKIDQLIALASVADSSYETIKRQMGGQPEFVSQAAIPLLDRLAKQESIPADEVPPFLMSLFSPKIQKYLQSFMLIKPKEELAKLSTPTLVLVGDTDIQITVGETEHLAAELPHVTLNVIQGMNHVLKPAPADRMANIATYSQPDLALHPELVPAILTFLQAESN